MLKLFSFFLFLFITANIFSQSHKYKLDRLTIDDGLSQNSVNCIMQDKNGFMWFGTQDGLNRYDGYNFKIYKHEPGNKNSLSNNYIWNIYEDKEGIFWISTFGGGLTRFDPSTETFSHFKRDPENISSLSNDFVFPVIEYPEGFLWICTDDGLNKLDKKNGEVKRFLNNNNNTQGLNNHHIGSLVRQGNNNLWMISDSGLTKMDIAKELFTHYKSDPFDEKINFGNIYQIKNEDDNLIISCTAGVIYLDFKNKISKFLLKPEKYNTEKIKYIFQNTLLDKRGYYWIGSNNGLFLLEKNAKKVYNYDQSNSEISHNNILSMYQSKSGVVWVGTRNGLNKIDNITTAFELYKHDPLIKNSYNIRDIKQILEEDNKLWICTSEGLTLFNRKNNQFKIIKNLPGSNYLLTILKEKNAYWIGTRGGGLNKLTFENNSDNFFVENFSVSEPTGLLANTIQILFKDKQGILWIGTGGGGLCRLNPDEKKFKCYNKAIDGTGPSHSYIFSILEDSFGNLWVGTATGGLNLFDPKSEEFLYLKNEEENLNSLSNNIILNIFEDDRKNLWIGTSNGLNKLTIQLRENLLKYFKDSVNLKTDSLFVRFDKNDGLPNEVIYGILEDDNKNLWFSTNKGIVKFNPQIKNPVIHIFDSNDGLQNNEFNQNAYLKLSTGELVFGGVDGFNIFHPDSIKLNFYLPPVVFTDFKLFNESVPLNKRNNKNNKNKFSLEKFITNTKEINLSYNDNVISFEFAALNYINPEKNNYAYMLEGFDKNWIYAGSQRNVTYTNLDPGEYIFKVKASNNDGFWNEQGASIKLFIPPPPWLSWYAYVFYSMIFAASVFLFIRFKIKSAKQEFEMQVKIEKAKLEEREEVRKKSSADFHDEAGNKLTKISLFTELAKGEAENPSLKEYLNKIEETTKELSSGMRDFIWVLDPKKGTLFDTINRLQDFANSIFNYTNVIFNVKGLTPEFKNYVLSMECRRAIILIFKEGINNSIKYSSADKIELLINVDKNFLQIILSDNGKGFIVERNTNGYGLNNMKERANKINCEFNIESNSSNGTKIILTGNIAHMSN
ncbi:MAG: two-component regulator propeller domain-containing protein [Ignavibacteriaceae bacterium]